MKPRLSIIVPTIRPHRLVTFYNSIKSTTNHEFEVIFCGPYNLPTELEQYKNIKCIRDFGSPTRAMQLCYLVAEGELVCYTSDDVTFLPGAINEAIETFPYENYKHMMIGTYMEGQNGTRKVIQPDTYWKINHAHPRSKFVSDDWYILNAAFMTLKFFIELGGFDCENFEGGATAGCDLSIRAYRAGATVTKLKNMVLDIDWAPGVHGYGDHEPIWNCQTNFDTPKYEKMHNDESLKDRTYIDFNNWKKAQPVWERRFK